MCPVAWPMLFSAYFHICTDFHFAAYTLIGRELQTIDSTWFYRIVFFDIRYPVSPLFAQCCRFHGHFHNARKVSFESVEILRVYPDRYHRWPGLAWSGHGWRFRSPGMPTPLTHGAWFCDMVLMTVRLSFVAPRAWWTTSWETPSVFKYINDILFIIHRYWCMYANTYICIYTCTLCVCMCIYIYIYACISQ